jgi:serine/threonine-protein kinase
MSDPCSFCGQLNEAGTPQCVACGATLAVASRSLAPGSLLREGHYRLGRVLGEGGFGITYQGTDLARGRAVALKEFFPVGSTRHGNRLVPPPTLNTESFQAMFREFQEEARLLTLSGLTQTELSR